MSNPRPERRPPATNHILRLRCSCCGSVYFLHDSVLALCDSGRCVSCDEEINQLELLYGDGHGGLR